MKLISRLWLGFALAMLTAGAAMAQASLTITSLTANPSSTQAGASTSMVVGVTNSGTSSFSGTADFSFTFTDNSGNTFTATSTGVSPSAPVAAGGGTGTFNAAITVPNSAVSNPYHATVNVTNVSSGASFTSGSFTNSGTVLTVTAAASGSPKMSVSSVGSSPNSAKPGDNVTMEVSATNNGASSPTDDFSTSDHLNFSFLFTNLTTGATFTRTGTNITPDATITAAGGSGTFHVPIILPTQTLQAGTYSTAVTISSPSHGTIGTGTFTNSSTVITIIGKPDLQITSLTYSASTSYTGGTVIPMSLTYTNNIRTNGVTNVPYVPGALSMPTFVRIQVVLSTNATWGDADDFQLTIQDINTQIDADGTTHTISWNQLLPGNFAGSYYVLAKIDSLDTLDENDAPTLTVNGNNIWGTPSLNPSAALINLLPTNFPTTSLVSHGAGATTSANAYSDNPSMSSDGRYVVFASDASNLVTSSSNGGQDTNGFRDIFIYDGQTNTIRRLSVSQQGAQGNGSANNPVISADGTYVAYASLANNMVLGDTNAFSDIFVVNTTTGLVARVSVATDGSQANNPSFKPSISSSGRYVVFESTATNLDPNYRFSANGGISHIYVHDRDVSGSGTFDTPGNTSTRLVDVDFATVGAVASSGAPGTPGNANAIQAAISADGSRIAFSSKATNLVSGGTTGTQHVYVRSRTNVGTTTSGIDLASVVNGTGAQGNADSQTPGLSSDGHYLVFASLASNLVAGDTNGVSDIFVTDVTTLPSNSAAPTYVDRRMSVTNSGAQGTDPSATGFQLGSINPVISANGRYVAFASLDDNLAAGDFVGQYQSTDANKALDVFVHDRDSSASGTYDTGTTSTSLVSVNPFGYQTTGLLGTPSTAANDIYPAISADGRYVAFPSDAENNAGLAFGATNQLPLDSNSARDVFIADRRLNTLPNPTTLPTVTITNPGNGGSALVNTPISVTASATTTSGVVSTVQFFVNGTSIGTSSVFPYSQTWTPTAVGTYTLSALVTDSFGNLGVSPNVSVTINAAPSVGITSPVGGNVITSGTTVNVAASAAASNPGATIAQVQFFANGQPLGTVTTAPYKVSWTPSSTGSYSLTAIATDSLGTQTTSPAVVVSVAAAAGSTTSTPPTVSLSPTPPSTATVNVPLTLTANASAAANLALVNVQYFANGVSIGSSSTYPFNVTWTPGVVGNYTITAVATDTAGNTTTSAGSVVAVSAGTGPSVSIASPRNGQTFALGTQVQYQAIASLSNTNGVVADVQFYVNGIQIADRTTVDGTQTAPIYQVPWSPSAAGTYVLTVVAIDSAGNRTTSAPTNVTVTAVNPPVVTITTPTANASLTVNAPQTISATASAGSGASVKAVSFFANNVLIAQVESFPFTTQWIPSATGTYALTAVATDSFQTESTSPIVNVTVGAGSSTAPWVYLTSVPTGAKFTANTPIFIAANAGDYDGKVTNVQFYANGKQIGSATAAPYAMTWSTNVASDYLITAVVTDDAGNRVTSQASAITINPQVGAVPAIGLDFNNPAVDVPAAGTTPPAVDPLKPIDVDFGSKLVVAADAVDQDGSIARIDFYANGTSIGSSTASPYYVIYPLATLQNVVLTAIATDSSGNAVQSQPIIINTIAANVRDNAVTLVSPNDGATYPAGSSIIFSATHNLGNVNPPKIDFYVNGFQFTTIKQGPYQSQLGITQAGSYDIQAVVRAGNFTTVSSTSHITVTSNKAPVVNITSVASGAQYVAGTSIKLAATASDPDGTIQSVQFYVNGSLLSTVKTSPFTTDWSPGSPGTYKITAVAIDDADNQGVSIPVVVTFTGNAAPSVSISTPSTGTKTTAGSAVPLVATAGDSDGTISSVRFLANGVVVGTISTAPYSAAWTPSAVGIYTVVAQAFDNSGNVASSVPVAINVGANQAPVVALTYPASAMTLRTGSSMTLTASAVDPAIAVNAVQFYANDTLVGSSATKPYSVTWTPATPGTYAITAQASNNFGTVARTSPVTVTVSANQPPVASFTTPANGAVVRTGFSTTVTLNATDPDGTVASVQFAANGAAIGSALTALPYRVQWTPAAQGVYTLTATVVDDSGATTVASINVMAVDASSASTDTIYTGTYAGLGENGNLAVINMKNRNATIIGYSTTPGVNKTYFLSDLPVNAAGGFSGTDSTGKISASGQISDTGAVGTLDGGRLTFIGIVGLPSATASVASGYYTGNLTGRMGATVYAIVGPDGSIMVYATDGTFQAAGSGFVDSAGNFRTTTGASFTGKADPATGLLTGSLSLGSSGGSFLGALASGVSFSDGFLHNLSTRGQVVAGSPLVAGFVVGGSTPKQVLVRAIGPSLAQFGITGVLADPQLQLYSGQTLINFNDNWNGDGKIAAAAASVGAFALNTTSSDAVLLVTLPPGPYTAQVSGVGGLTGAALVELYDTDALSPFSAQKVVNLSTRGTVTPGNNGSLVAGFYVTGTTAKKLLIRGVGPSLGAAPFNIPGVLADPQMRIVRTDGVTIRENDDWSVGNDVALMTDATTKVGAFPLLTGSKDAAMLINLQPGAYTVQITGPNNAGTGVALVEVYEVP